MKTKFIFIAFFSVMSAFVFSSQQSNNSGWTLQIFDANNSNTPVDEDLRSKALNLFAKEIKKGLSTTDLEEVKIYVNQINGDISAVCYYPDGVSLEYLQV